MASPAPAKSQPLHNFSLPYLNWNTNHNSGATAAAAAAADQHHHRSRTRLSTPPPPQPPPSSLLNPRRASPNFDPPRRQSSPASTFVGGHVSKRHSPLLDSLPKQSSGESESDFRRHRSPASASRRQTSPSYTARKQSPFHDSESDFNSSATAAVHKSPAPELFRSDLTILPLDATKFTQSDPKFVLSNEKRKRTKITLRNGKTKLDETTQNDYLVKSTPPEGTSGEAAGEDDESVPKTWNLRPRRPINKQSNVNGNGIDHKLGGSLSKELRSAMNNVLPEGIQPVEKKEKKQEYSISVSLSRREIEEDIYALTGSKPSRRPKKRSKAAQRQIEAVLPGMWLGTINADMYKVSEAPSKV